MLQLMAKKSAKWHNHVQTFFLENISGRVGPGEMVAIIGGSCSGKTALLNVLTGRVTEEGCITGDIRINGRHRPGSAWKRLAGYVEHDCALYVCFTVRETLEFVAMAKLPAELSGGEKLQRVEQLIASLGLADVADTRLSSISDHSQKKRIAIAIELVSNPQLVFFAEPTSGLDSFSAFQLLRTLRWLVDSEKKTFLMTLHQPQAMALRLFTKVLFLTQGRVVFFGGLDDAVQHFTNCGFPFPVKKNPADHIIDITSLDMRSREAERQSKKNLDRLCKSWAQIELTRMDHPATVTLDTSSSQLHIGDTLCWQLPFLSEIMLLARRSLTIQLRNRSPLGAIFLQAVALAVILGCVYFQLPDDTTGGQDRLGLMLFLSVRLMFAFISTLTVAFSFDRAIILRERYSATYRVSSFLLASFLTAMPIRFAATLVPCIILYYVTGLRTDGFQHFVVFFSIFLLCAIAAIALGYAIGAWSRNSTVANLIGSQVLATYLIFTGSLINLTSMPPLIGWVKYLTVSYYAFQAAIQNELKGQTFGTQTGDQILASRGLDQIPFAGCIGAIIGLTIVLLLICYAGLRIRTRPRIRLI